MTVDLLGFIGVKGELCATLRLNLLALQILVLLSGCADSSAFTHS